MGAFFRRVADRVARALGRSDAGDLAREVRLAARDFGRKPYLNVSKAGHGGSVSGALGPFRFVFWPGGLGDNPIVHPRSLTLLLGPWRAVSLRVGRYAVFTRLHGTGINGADYGYLRVWRFASLPAGLRETYAADWITRRDLDLFPMVGRVSAADLPIPQEPCDECGFSFPAFELEPVSGLAAGRYCYDCAEAARDDLEDARSLEDAGDWDERMSAQIDSWDQVYA